MCAVCCASRIKIQMKFKITIYFRDFYPENDSAYCPISSPSHPPRRCFAIGIAAAEPKSNEFNGWKFLWQIETVSQQIVSRLFDFTWFHCVGRMEIANFPHFILIDWNAVKHVTCVCVPWLQLSGVEWSVEAANWHRFCHFVTDFPINWIGWMCLLINICRVWSWLHCTRPHTFSEPQWMGSMVCRNGHY